MANSSVLIALSTIGKLELLVKRIPEGILIPQAVWREVVETGKGQAGAAEVASAKWIGVCEVKDRGRVTLLQMELDDGEAEAIALCRERQTKLILLDEKDARRVARRLGLAALGTVGVLIWAKRNGLITHLREELDILQSRGAFRLDQSVYEEALRTVGEVRSCFKIPILASSRAGAASVRAAGGEGERRETSLGCITDGPASDSASVSVCSFSGRASPGSGGWRRRLRI